MTEEQREQIENKKQDGRLKQNCINNCINGKQARG